MKTLETITWFLIVAWTAVAAVPAPAQTGDAPQELPVESAAAPADAPEAAAADAPEVAPADLPEDSLEARCQREVEELNQFFQGWTNGAIEDTDEEFARFASVTADTFAVVSPSGRISDRQKLLKSIRESHGQPKDPAEGVRIRIDDFAVRAVAGDVAIVTYELWMELGGKSRGRIATAVLRARDGTPNGIEWLHVHETWLP
jgi:hypothetical protein